MANAFDQFDYNDPTDLQGREREGGLITPEELDRLWQAQQRANELMRARAMNEPQVYSVQSAIDSVPQRALIAGNPTAASIQNASNPFDQFDSSGNVFDQFDAGGGAQGTVTVGPLEDVRMGEQTPQTPADYGAQIGGEPQLSPQGIAGVQQNLGNLGGAALDTVKGLPSMLAQIPKYGYEGVKVQTGNESLLDSARTILHDAVPQGQAMAAGLQSPVGSRQFDAAAIQAAMMGLPALDLLPKGLKGAEVAPEAHVREPGIPASASEAPVGVETAPPAPEGAKVASPFVQYLEDIVSGRPVSVYHGSQTEGLTELSPNSSVTLSKPLAERFAQGKTTYSGQMIVPQENPAYSRAQDLLNEIKQGKDVQSAESEFNSQASEIRTGNEKLPVETGDNLRPQPADATIPSQDEFAETLPTQQAGGAENVSGQQPEAANTGQPGVGQPSGAGVGGERGYSSEQRPAGTSNRQNVETYGEDVVPGGQGADTLQLLDNARADIRSGAVDPYSVLSKTRADGIASPKEYAALAAEHERLVNDAVAKEKAGDPTAPEAARQTADFANAIQPHKTAASDLMRLFQGDLNYDLSTDFGMEQYMKAELGRGMKPNEVTKFRGRAQGIRRAETEAGEAVGRSDVKVQRAYAKVRDIPMEEAAARVKEWLKDCVV